MNPTTKKCNGLKCRDLSGQAIRSPLPIQRPGNVSFKNVIHLHDSAVKRSPIGTGKPTELVKHQSFPAYQGGRSGLVVRSRLRGWRVPGLKPDSTEDSPCMRPSAR
ncbi:hypothetical protein AVEN_95378-1 [Araneus ventricosus]|uniref:Uncharacterized protein n=1 Tax=Araneus ventricosus TaxID=182803 RepID=A0A4Y2CJL5_ARAVE|nr:hypothetical protein AVEN_95378-1 [Araneus ventricosus]